MAQQLDPALKELLISDLFRPAVVYWNRLEGRPRTEAFDRTLRAEVRDPMWMLCQQWQFGEFDGEDAGSAVQAKVQIETTRLNRYAAKSGTSAPFDDRIPLETQVERETIFQPHKTTQSVDLQMRIVTGRHWFKLLKQLAGQSYRSTYLKDYAFDDPAAIVDPSTREQLNLARLHSDRSAWQTFEAVKHRVVDGYKLLTDIDSGAHETWVNNHDDFPTDTDKTAVKEAAQAFVTWFQRVFSQPEATETDAWQPDYLEYQFACAAPADTNDDEKIVLVAEGYTHGRLDQYAFDRAGETVLPPDQNRVDIPDSQFRVEPRITFIPTPIGYHGMPNVRWWEFEDQQTDFGDLRASTSDIALLMLAEFGLIYGNDWSVIPYDLQTGTLSEVKGIVVTDVFGVRTFIRPAIQTTPDRQQWHIYNLHVLDPDLQTDSRLFLAPATAKVQESRPIEKVSFVKDEMANMVLGVEDVIPGVLGNGVNGFEAGLELSRFLQPDVASQGDDTLLENEADI